MKCIACALNERNSHIQGPAREVHRDAIALSEYMSEDSEFDKAIAEFAMAYADQTVRDWHALLGAINAGRLVADVPST